MEQVLPSNTPAEVDDATASSLEFSKENVFLLCCTLAAFLVRLLFIPTDSVINGDGAYYTTLGEKLVSGDVAGGISGYWSPLYSAFTGLASLFFEREFAGRSVSLLAGSLLIIPAYFLVREFYGRTAAYLATILLVIHPSLVKSSAWVMTESLYTLIFTAVLLAGWHALRDAKTHDFVLTGLLLGAGYLTKPESLGFLLLQLFLIVLAMFLRPAPYRSRYAAGFLLLLLGFSVFFVPYAAFLRQKTGSWTISQKIMINLPVLDYEGEMLELTADGSTTIQDKIWNDDYWVSTGEPSRTSTPQSPPVESPGIASAVRILSAKGLLLLKKQIRDYFPELLPYPFILLAFVGFFFHPWSRLRTAKEFYLLFFVGSTLIGYAFSAVELRYLYPLVPVLIAWVANGIIGFSQWARASLVNLLEPWRVPSPLVIQIAILCVFAALMVPALIYEAKPGDLQNVPFEDKQAGLWIKSNSPIANAVVMSPNAIVAFYAEAKHVFLPDEDLPTIIDYAKRRKANYIVFSQRRTRFNESAFHEIEEGRYKDLTLAYHDEPAPGYKIAVYQLSN